MFVRVEVAMKTEFSDPGAQGLLRKIELAHPEIRRQIRWARLLEVYWLDLPCGREELIPAIGEVLWDRVLQWLFTGNMIPSASGKHGGMQDLMAAAPNRPGKFWALEKRFRGGVTDNVARTALEAFEIVLGRKLPEGRAASGQLVLLEAPGLNEDTLALLARDVFCNELIESWSILPESELSKNDRFHQERVKRDMPRVSLRGSDQVQTYALSGLKDEELEQMSRRNLWALSLAEMQAIRDHFAHPEVQALRKNSGLPAEATDVEIEVLAQTWSEHCKHKIFASVIDYQSKSTDGPGAEIPAQVDHLFKTTIAGTTKDLPKPWLLSVFEDNAGIIAIDDEDAFCIKVETHNSPSALDPYGGALTGIVGVNRDILGCGLGAKPVFNTDVFCVAPPDFSGQLPDRILHPRRILSGVRQGVEHGGNKSGIPTVNGALCFDDRYLGKPLIYCGTGGIMPRTIAGRACESKEVQAGDRICMVGGRIGKDGIHGATFSSLAMDELSPASAVQLGDPITQKRAADFLLEARDLGLYRAITDNGAGGLSSSVGEMARISGGAKMDVAKAKTKYPGLKPFELVVSESQERMTLAVPPEKLEAFMKLAERRGVEACDLGEFTASGKFEILHQEKAVGVLDLEFLHGGAPRLHLKAEWAGRPKPTVQGQTHSSTESFAEHAPKVLAELLGRPNIASKEWLIRQYDHEVQGMSVVKPLNTAHVGTSSAGSGPNDAGVIKPKPGYFVGVAVGCGINPKLSDIDPYLMAQSAVDEAVRNVLCVGAEFGKETSVLALVDNFCWPDPVGNPDKAAALVRACYGMREAALALKAPLVSGKDSMKNDYRGKRGGKDVVISVPPTLLITAIGKLKDVREARTADFKSVGDVVYLIGGNRLGLRGSEFETLRSHVGGATRAVAAGAVVSSETLGRIGEPDWAEATRIYDWFGGAQGKEQGRIRSLHDVSEGGTLVAIVEGLLARSYGASIELPASRDSWEICFGEGFHSFICSVSEADAFVMETEWKVSGIPFVRLGAVTPTDRFEVRFDSGKSWSVPMKELKAAWKKEGYWE